MIAVPRSDKCYVFYSKQQIPDEGLVLLAGWPNNGIARHKVVTSADDYSALTPLCNNRR